MAEEEERTIANQADLSVEGRSRIAGVLAKSEFSGIGIKPDEMVGSSDGF